MLPGGFIIGNAEFDSLDKMGTTRSIIETFFSLRYKIPSDFLVLVLSILCKIHFLFVDQNISGFCVLIFV